MILNDLEESDTEFWADFSQAPPISSCHSPSKPNYEGQLNSKFLSFSPNSPIKAPGITSILWTREYFEEKLNRVRESNEMQIEKSTIKAKNKVRRHYSDKLEALKHKYLTDFKTLMAEFNNLKDTLNMKDEYIHILTEILAESQSNITETMTKLMKKRKTEVDLKKNAENSVLVEEVRFLRDQVINLKELCTIYQKDTDKAINALGDLEKIYENFKNETEKKVKIMQDVIESKEKIIEKINSTKMNE